MKKLIIVLLSVFFVVFLSGCVDRYEYKDVTAVVVNKEFHDSYTTTSFISSGKTLVPITDNHPAEYIVTIKYDNLKASIDNEALYKKTKVNDKIVAYIKNGYTKENKLESTELVLSKE